MKTIINNTQTNNADLLLVTLHSWDNQTICTPNDLKKALEGVQQPIASIKRFNPAKGAFQKVSRKEIFSLVWDTETQLFLENHYYFKGKI